MYEELVKRLRKAAGPAINFPDTLYDEAADAIEEMSRAQERNALLKEIKKLKGEKTMDVDLIDRIDRMERQMLNNQLIIMGALDDLIMHGGGNRWAKVHLALTALHDGMASTSAILAQSVEPPKEGHDGWEV